MNDVNVAGCCVVCNTPIYEVITQYPADSPLRGRPRVLGKPLPSLRTITMRLRGGSFTTVTACATCAESNFDMLDVWKKILRSWAEEMMSPEYRLAIGSAPLTDKDLEEEKAWLARMHDCVPILILDITEGSHG